MSRLAPMPAATLASGFMLCCADSMSLTTDASIPAFMRIILAATASCISPTRAPIRADTRLAGSTLLLRTNEQSASDRHIHLRFGEGLGLGFVLDTREQNFRGPCRQSRPPRIL